MSMQGWIMLVVVALVAAACVRRFTRTLANKGEGAGCCGDCSCAKRKPAPRA